MKGLGEVEGSETRAGRPTEPKLTCEECTKFSCSETTSQHICR